MASPTLPASESCCWVSPTQAQMSTSMSSQSARSITVPKTQKLDELVRFVIVEYRKYRCQQIIGRLFDRGPFRDDGGTRLLVRLRPREELRHHLSGGVSERGAVVV